MGFILASKRHATTPRCITSSRRNSASRCFGVISKRERIALFRRLLVMHRGVVACLLLASMKPAVGFGTLGGSVQSLEASSRTSYYFEPCEYNCDPNKGQKEQNFCCENCNGGKPISQGEYDVQQCKTEHGPCRKKCSATSWSSIEYCCDYCNGGKDHYAGGTDNAQQCKEQNLPLMCSSDTCTPAVLEAVANGKSCIRRIEWLMRKREMSEADACAKVADEEYPDICGDCSP